MNGEINLKKNHDFQRDIKKYDILLNSFSYVLFHYIFTF